MKKRLHRAYLSAFCALLTGTPAFAAGSAEERNLTELRNTVVNLLQALVERGVVTREQAQAMVKDAQAKAEAETTAKAAQEKEDEGAVRVPYVPQIVKEEIRKEVVADLTPTVSKEVIEQTHAGAGLRDLLPDWVQRMQWSGDIRVRGEGDSYASSNVVDVYPNFQAINSAGGITKAGTSASLNTTEDHNRLRARLRFGFDTQLGSGWTGTMRVATGALNNPVSTNQTLGNYAERYTLGVDQAYLSWRGDTEHQSFTAWGGRMPSPWVSTDIVWDPDVMFEGVAANYRVNLFGSEPGDPFRHNVFLTLGAFPMWDVVSTLSSSKDKWLFAGQLGFDWRTESGHRFKLAGAYYDYEYIVGQRNALNSTLLDYTAPQFLQRGNTLFDIRNNPDDPTVNLFALAADYKMADVTASTDWQVFQGYRVSIVADYVKNVGYDKDDVFARTGRIVEPRTKGYNVEVSFGSRDLSASGRWRAFASYRHLERDAVLDAFTDSDFGLGGTDTKGHILGLQYAFTPRVQFSARYLASNAIDGPPLGIDVWLIDFTAQF